MNQYPSYKSVDTDANPYCDPLTVMERVGLIAMVCLSVVTVIGGSGYLYARFVA